MVELEADMTNREWLYSLDPHELSEWFESKHSNAAGAEQAPMMVHTPDNESNGTADCESDGADDVFGELVESLEAAYAKNRSLRAHIRKMQEGRNGLHIKARKLQEEVDELQKQVDKLKDGRKCETCDEPARAGSIRPFLVWDYKGNLLITLGGLRTWDVTAEARAWFKKFGGDAR